MDNTIAEKGNIKITFIKKKKRKSEKAQDKIIKN